MNFIFSCGVVLQKYDAERDEAWLKQQAAMVWGAEFKDSAPKSSSTNRRKQTLTQQEIMHKYGAK